MQCIGNLRVLNKQPYILISHEDISAIQHIVNIAPQEAQWFHRVEKIDYDGAIIYRVYEMYIPEQYCSGAEVESDPMMMVNLYKDLKEKHGQEETNNILNNMTGWSHSHHNMGVNPSGQDQKQFKEQCENALKSNISSPQIMFIFNKKDNYYCRVWDPELNLEFENVDIIIGNYDFEWIDKEAKAKFKKKAVVKTTSKYRSNKANKAVLDWHDMHNWQPTSRASNSGSSKKKEKSESYSYKARIQSNKKNKSSLPQVIEKLELDNDKLKKQFLLLEKNSTSMNATEHIVEYTKSLLSEVELAYLSILLTGSQNDIWYLEDYQISNVDDPLKSVVELHDTLIDGLLDYDIYKQAITHAILIGEAKNSETAEQVIDMWLTVYEESFHFDHGYTDSAEDWFRSQYAAEEERNLQHIRSIIEGE